MNTTTWHPSLTAPVSPERDQIIGTVSAPVTLLEYGDYQCPYCGMAYPIIKQVLQELGDDLCFVFRHFPITTIHPFAEGAAEAAEAAGAQGDYWLMHNRLYEHQDRLAPADLLGHASALGLDGARFERELTTHAYQQKVRDDFMSGVRSGVNGTPTFYINGVRHDAAWDYESLLAALVVARETPDVTRRSSAA